MTANQTSVLVFLKRMEDPCTVREIADARSLPVSSVRSALAALEQNGDVERRGVAAFTGGTTWGPVK